MEQTIVGKKDPNRNLIDLTAGDPWAETPFYGQGDDIESDFIQPWPVGGLICGTYYGLRTANKNGPTSKQRKYAVMKTIDGDRFRIYTPGQLAYQLARLTEGAYVEITYKGKEYVESLERDCHQFEVKADESSFN